MEVGSASGFSGSREMDPAADTFFASKLRLLRQVFKTACT
jgi:hypothetical protein